jgi:hypothetical protein
MVRVSVGAGGRCWIVVKHGVRRGSYVPEFNYFHAP